MTHPAALVGRCCKDPRMSRHGDANEVYDACASIPAGIVITYSDLAQLAGRPPSHARAVASMLAVRPHEGTSLDPLPWWRVVRSDGSLRDPDQITGAREQGVNLARSRLVEEGVPFTNDGRVNMNRANRMPIPGGVERPLRPQQQTTPEPCWNHETVQYSCRDCTSPVR